MQWVGVHLFILVGSETCSTSSSRLAILRSCRSCTELIALCHRAVLPSSLRIALPHPRIFKHLHSVHPSYADKGWQNRRHGLNWKRTSVVTTLWPLFPLRIFFCRCSLARHSFPVRSSRAAALAWAACVVARAVANSCFKKSSFCYTNAYCFGKLMAVPTCVTSLGVIAHP